MKVIMYHYVRSGDTALPYFPYLDVDDFRQQLDFFEERFGFVSRDDYVAWSEGRVESAPEGVLLTFDDGLRDHFDHVLPLLSSRGIFALFYVSSGPLVDDVMLDVHKVHLIVGRRGSAYLMDSVLEHFGEAQVYGAATRAGGAYAGQGQDNAAVKVKRFLNWECRPEQRAEFLTDCLHAGFDGVPPKVADYYCSEAELRDMMAAGMGIGAHGHKHLILSRLDEDEQAREIRRSRDFTRDLCGTLQWGYCYAHGVPAALNEHSLQLVQSLDFPFAFGVYDQDLPQALAASPTFNLPRYNCNGFPHGKASFAGSGQ